MKYSIAYIIDFMGKRFTMSFSEPTDDIERIKMLVKCNQNEGSIVREYHVGGTTKDVSGEKWLLEV